MTPAQIKRYHAWIREQPCIECGKTPTDVSHYTGSAGHYLGKGKAQKAHHLMAAPHCRFHHERVEAREMWRLPIEDDFTNRLSHSEGMLVHIARTLIKAVDEGVLKI